MKFDLKRPCANCPFVRGAKRVVLTKDRVLEIRSALERVTFGCHKTVDYNAAEPQGNQHCAGALTLKEKLGESSQMMRIAERLGFYDHTRLDMDADVFDSWEEMVDASV